MNRRRAEGGDDVGHPRQNVSAVDVPVDQQRGVAKRLGPMSHDAIVVDAERVSAG